MKFAILALLGLVTVNGVKLRQQPTTEEQAKRAIEMCDTNGDG